MLVIMTASSVQRRTLLAFFGGEPWENLMGSILCSKISNEGSLLLCQQSKSTTFCRCTVSVNVSAQSLRHWAQTLQTQRTTGKGRGVFCACYKGSGQTRICLVGCRSFEDKVSSKDRLSIKILATKRKYFVRLTAAQTELGGLRRGGARSRSTPKVSVGLLRPRNKLEHLNFLRVFCQVQTLVSLKAEIRS